MFSSIVVLFKENTEMISLFIGIVSLVLSTIAFINSKKTKKIADRARKETLSIIQDNFKNSLIQKLIDASNFIRDTAFQYKNRSIPKQRQTEISKHINTLSDNKKCLQDYKIENQIAELPKFIDSPETLYKATNVLISNLKNFKYTSGYKILSSNN